MSSYSQADARRRSRIAMRQRRMGPPTWWERAAAPDRLETFGQKRPARPNAYSVPVAEITAVSPADVASVFWKQECECDEDDDNRPGGEACHLRAAWSSSLSPLQRRHLPVRQFNLQQRRHAAVRIVAAKDRTERGIATLPFFLNGVVNVFEGLGGGSWIGGGYHDGEEA